MRLVLNVRRNDVLNIHRGKSLVPSYIFSVVEFKVASLNRYFENVQYQIADSVKSNIYPQNVQGYVTRETNTGNSVVGGNTIVEKAHRL